MASKANSGRANAESKMDYQQQAEDMLASMSAKMTTKFVRNGLYFPDDKVSRDVYRITIKRAGKSWSFLFGQSINKSGYNKNPEVYDILASITKNNVGTFNDFCCEFGYNTDSRSAEKVYKAVVREYANLCRLFTLNEIEQLQAVQ